MAIELDGHTKTSGSGAGPHTLSHTCGGSHRLLAVVFTGMRSGTGSWSVTGVTYNGTSLTQAAANESSGSSRNVRTEVWYLVNPPGGSSYTVSVSTSSTMLGCSLAAISLTGVDQSSPVGNTGTDTGNKSAYAASISTGTADAWLVGGAGLRNGNRTWSPDSGVTEIYERASGSDATNDIVGCGLYRSCGASGSYSIGASADASNFGVLAAMAVNAAVLDATISMARLAATAAAVSLGVVPGALSMLMDVLTGTMSGVKLSVVPGAVSISADTLPASGAVIDLSVVPGAVSISADTLPASGAVIDLSVVPGAVSMLMDELALSGVVIDLTVAQSVLMATLNLLANIPDISVAVAATTIAMAVLEHVLAVNPLTVVPGAVVLNMAALDALVDAVAILVSVIGTDETILMSALSAAFNVEQLAVLPGEYITEMQTLQPTLTIMPLTVFMLLGCALAADRARYGAIVSDAARYYATVSDRTGCQ